MKALQHNLVFRSYGVIIGISTDDRGLDPFIRNSIDRGLAKNYMSLESDEADHWFHFARNDRGFFEIRQNTEVKYIEKDIAAAQERLTSSVRLRVAEFALNRVFIHAGAVSMKGQGIIIPARSFKGKSTLTAALVRQGARYYSDEYAVLDKRGRLHPFAKDLSIRGKNGDFIQTDASVESIGGIEGKRPIPIKLVAVTEFNRNAVWKPKHLNIGAAAIEILKNCVSIRRNPKFVMPILAIVSANALTVKSKRGEADVTARMILDLLELQ